MHCFCIALFCIVLLHVFATSSTNFLLENKYSEHWKSKVSSSPRLEFFTRIKPRHERDPFLNTVKNFDVKRTYYKFRTSNHSLCIETDRYRTPVIPRERRLCKFCSANKTEDELHFLFECNFYNDLRQIFFKKLKEVTGVDSTDHLNTIFALFTSVEPTLTTHLANYIHKCFSKRKQFQMEV